MALSVVEERREERLEDADLDARMQELGRGARAAAGVTALRRLTAPR